MLAVLSSLKLLLLLGSLVVGKSFYWCLYSVGYIIGYKEWLISYGAIDYVILIDALLLLIRLLSWFSYSTSIS